MTEAKIAEEKNPEGRGRALKLPAAHLLLLFVLSFFFLFLNLGSYSLKEPDEGRYAEIPREMVETGDYVVPRLNYVRYFEKPPLHYWVTALSYQTLGIGEWSFRIPNVLAALFCVLALYVSIRKWFNARTALASAVILLSSFGFFAMGRIITIDMLFTCLLFISLLAFYGYYRERRMGSFYLFYTCLALSTLAKGPVALILVGLTVLLFLVVERNFAFLRDLFRLKGLLLYGCITVPWFVAIALREKEFLWFFFVDQHFLRFLTTNHQRSGPPYYFIPVLLGGMFPWSLLIPRSIVALWRVKELRLFFIWSLVVFAFFSLSGSKLPPYILPAFPAISVILGYLFCNRWSERIPWAGEIALYQLFFAVLGLTGLLAASGKLPGLLDLTPKIIDILKETRGLSIVVSILSAGLFILFCAKNMRRFKTAFTGLVAFSLAIIVLLMLHAPVIDRLSSTKELAQLVSQRRAGPEAVVVNYGSFEETLPFYTRGRVLIVSYQGELAMGATYPDTKELFLSPEAFVTLFHSDKQVLAVLKEPRLHSLRELGIRNPVLLGCQDGRCLISNQ
jgi:4-amino-4-deoxy-L-arabinose transferase-like glycosyltransferase